MKKLIKFRFTIFKWIVAALAVGNLIFLFVFNYQLPGFLRPNTETSAAASDNVSEPTEPVKKEASIAILVPDEPLSYDGTSTLDLAQGVSITDPDGTIRSDINLFSVIKPGASRKEKVIEYSASDDNKIRVTANRTLLLNDSYTGPFIEIHGDIPQLSNEDLSVIVPLLISKNILYAEDGFGTDVTAAVTSSVTTPADSSGNAVVTLTITNIVNDSSSVDVSVYTGPVSGPRMTLTKNKDTLNIGDTFNFYNYIESAIDEEGNDLHSHISVDGSVDTSKAGTYTVEFYCVDDEGTRSNVETLTVTVH